MRPLVETDWLLKNLDKVKIFDFGVGEENYKRALEKISLSKTQQLILFYFLILAVDRCE